MVCHATGETVLHKAARLGYEVLQGSDICMLLAVIRTLCSIISLCVFNWAADSCGQFSVVELHACVRESEMYVQFL